MSYALMLKEFLEFIIAEIFRVVRAEAFDFCIKLPFTILQKFFKVFVVSDFCFSKNTQVIRL